MKNLLHKATGFTILTAILLLFGVGCMTSCGRVVKEVTKTNTVVDSTAVKEKDSIIQVKQSSISRLESELRETQYSGVVFDDTPLEKGADDLKRGWLSGPLDTISTGSFRPCPDNKVTIKADGTIEASGNIKSANVTKDKYQKTIADWERKYDSLYKVKTKDSTTVKTVTNTVTKFKDRGNPWWFWVLIGVWSVFLVVVTRKLSRLKTATDIVI